MGSLHLLPFASLRDANGEYWIQPVKVASAPSATILQRLRSTRDSGDQSRPFLGIAFSPSTADASMIQASRSRTAFFGDHPIDLKPLPYAQQEVSAAAQVLGQGSVLLLNEKATETALKAQSLGKSRSSMSRRMASMIFLNRIVRGWYWLRRTRRKMDSGKRVRSAGPTSQRTS